jgi:hypothetical protein
MAPIKKLSWLALGAALVLLPSASEAQRANQLVLYSEIGFRGRSITVSGSQSLVNVPFTVRSARIAPREAWQVCPLPAFQGPCTTFQENQGNILWRVSSARPRTFEPTPAPLPSPVPPGGGTAPSLRGMSAEFFPQPSDRNGRVESCAQGTARCAQQSADRFCQSRGWTASAHEAQETINRRNLLADVLCTQVRTR